MKKIIILLIFTIVIVGTLNGCSKNAETNANTNTVTDNKDKLSIVCTIFPEYDWVKQIVGSHTDEIDITMLLDNGVDLHSYQPTVDDMVKISNCDMFIYVGGESDAWVKDALKEAKNKDMVVVNLLDVLGDTVKEEEIKEGMENHEHDEGEVHEEGEEHEYDEHVWLSLKNAEILCNFISEKLCELDVKNAEDYKANVRDYVNKLATLDDEYTQTVNSSKYKTVLFGDRFPFRYMVEDYNLDYYAAFVGCSAETEASFETIVFLANKIDELGLPCVITIEGSNHKITETIIQNTKDKNQKILTMDSMQATTLKDVEAGTTYLSIMTENLVVLKEALNG